MRLYENLLRKLSCHLVHMLTMVLKTSHLNYHECLKHTYLNPWTKKKLVSSWTNVWCMPHIISFTLNMFLGNNLEISFIYMPCVQRLSIIFKYIFWHSKHKILSLLFSKWKWKWQKKKFFIFYNKNM